MAYLWGLIYFSVCVWSFINPHDYTTWWMEATPALIALPVLFFTRKSFPLTPLAYSFILLHCIVLFIGAHYTYAEVPLFNWIEETFNQQRNNYDKLGHFIQGFVPAIIAREIVIRKEVFNSRKWMNFFIVCFCLAVSACYELIEWGSALLEGEAAEAFLGTQGYVWDTQADMGTAFVGAVCSLLLLSALHDKQLQHPLFLPAQTNLR